jgi:hypothetical protein
MRGLERGVEGLDREVESSSKSNEHVVRARRALQKLPSDEDELEGDFGVSNTLSRPSCSQPPRFIHHTDTQPPPSPRKKTTRSSHAAPGPLGHAGHPFHRLQQGESNSLSLSKIHPFLHPLRTHPKPPFSPLLPKDGDPTLHFPPPPLVP